MYGFCSPTGFWQVRSGRIYGLAACVWGDWYGDTEIGEWSGVLYGDSPVDGDMEAIFPELWRLRGGLRLSVFSGTILGDFIGGMGSGFVVFGSCVVLYMKSPRYCVRGCKR